MDTANNSPRVVLQPGALFLMTPEGEVWRVHDTDQNGTSRTPPSTNLGVRARLFVAATSGLTLIHRFPARNSRAIDAATLLEQLDTAATC
jgi:hypothetical protein